jgi:hypothetical protein
MPRLLSRPLSCDSYQALSVFAASDAVSDDEVPIPCLYVSPPWRPSAHVAAASLADSDNEDHIPQMPPRSGLVTCDSVDEAPIPRPMLSHPLVRPHPALQGSCRGPCPLGST